MDFLKQYGDGSSSEDGSPSASELPLGLLTAPTVNAAPAVDTTGLVLSNGEVTSAAEVASARATLGSKHTLAYNPTADELGLMESQGAVGGVRNHLAGHVEDLALPPAVFDEQYNTFQAHGIAQTVDRSIVRSKVYQGPDAPDKRTRTEAEQQERRARKEARRAAEDTPVDPDASWRLRSVQPWATKEAKATELTAEQREYMEKIAAEKAAKDAAKSKEPQGPTSTWHGAQGKDWQGRSWLAAPKGGRNPPDTCFLPKKWLHTWGSDGSGHNKGVNAIRFFPTSGHLLLSAGMDGKVKIWDVYNTRKCKRTYAGHGLGVRAVTFNHDGTKFLSAAYDKQMHYWDTETGQVIRTIRHSAAFICATMHPDPSQEHIVLAGATDKRIYQFDLTTGDLQQQYTHQLGPVNTITFFDGGARFVATSDDKRIRLFDLSVDVPTAIIQGEKMYSMPAAASHPNGKNLCFTSLDSTIVTYNLANGRLRYNGKKLFRGHTVGGNACQIGFSPDGKYIMSGDAQGRLHFWEWKAPGRIAKTIPAHDKAVCICCVWHPLETSKVATCGWDGLIKYWD